MSDARPDHRPGSTGTLRRAALSAARVDLAGLAPAPALRAAAGCTAVLAASLALVGPGAASAATVGALLAAIPALSGARRRPLAAMATTTCGIALSSFVGSVTAHVAAAHLVVLAGWAFGGGMLVALGDAGSVVGTQAAMAFVVFGRFAEGPVGAAKAAAYVAAGGAFQTALTAITRWPLALRAQRRAIADAYRLLGELALGGPEGSSLPAGLALDAAEAELGAPAVFRRTDVSGLRSLVDEGRRIRVELASLEALRQQLDRSGGGRTPAHLGVERVLAEGAYVLDGVADALAGRRAVSVDALEHELAAVAAADRPAGRRDADDPREHDTDGALGAAIASHLATLGGQLRAVAGLAAQVVDGTAVPAALARRGTRAGRRATVAQQLATVRANLSLRSTACRHAVRLAVVVPLAELVADHTPLQRGYWIALTAALVLRPDFGGTLSRGVARLFGTVAGVGITGVLVAGGNLGDDATVVVITLLAFGAFTSFRASYAAYSAFLTGLVVILVNLATPGAHSSFATALDRLVDTVVGGALALAVYAAWPTWSSGEARHALAELTRAEQAYLDAVTAPLVGRGRVPEASARALARRLRLARSNCEATIARSLSEPRSRRIDGQLASGVLAALRRSSLATHVLRTSLEPGRAPDRVPGLAPLAAALVSALGEIAESLEAGRAPEVPALRPLHGDLVDETAGLVGMELLVVETDELVNAIDTVAALIAQPVAPSD